MCLLVSILYLKCPSSGLAIFNEQACQIDLMVVIIPTKYKMWLKIGKQNSVIGERGREVKDSREQKEEPTFSG